MAQNQAPQDGKENLEHKPTTSQVTEASSSGGGFSMPKIFDLSQLTQSRDGKETAGKLYNYFWKTFDFRNGRTLEKVTDDHPYCKDPAKNMSKFSPFQHGLTLSSFTMIRLHLHGFPLG